MARRSGTADLPLHGASLVRNSRMSAKVDSAAVQDGFQIYQHSFFLTADGAWAVVQQGMREGDGSARRYHWLGERVRDFVCEPHAAICSEGASPQVLDLVAESSQGVRRASAELSREAPVRVLAEAQRIARLEMPRRHWVDPRTDVLPKNLPKVLLATWEAAPPDFETLLGLPGVGARTLRALALIAEVVYGETASARDPARFSFAHGGKDGHPFPVDRETYDRSIAYLREAVDRARVGNSDRVAALRRLSRWEGDAAAVARGAHARDDAGSLNPPAGAPAPPARPRPSP